MIVTVSPCQGHTPRPEDAWSMHGWSPGPGRWSRMLTLNEIEGEMATANTRVNELVVLQADMLLKAAKVRSSCRYRNSAKCQVSRINSMPMRNAEVTRQWEAVASP